MSVRANEGQTPIPKVSEMSVWLHAKGAGYAFWRGVYGQVIATDHPAAIHDNVQVQQAYLGTHAKDKTDA